MTTYLSIYPPACPPVEVWSVATEKQVERTHTHTHMHAYVSYREAGRPHGPYGRPLELLPFAEREEGWLEAVASGGRSKLIRRPPQQSIVLGELRDAYIYIWLK